VGKRIHILDLWLSQAKFVYNSSVNGNVGLPPFKIVYGQMPLLYVDISFHTIERESEEII